TIGIAVIVAAALNVDSVMITRHLAQDGALRTVIAAEATQAAQQPPPDPEAVASSSVRSRVRDIDALGNPLGWPTPAGAPTGLAWYLTKVLGILLTAGA